MILFDTTKTGSARHRSGLTRVSSRLREVLGGNAEDVRWNGTTRSLESRRAASRADWLLTAELFSEEERPGFSDFLAAPPCRTAAIYHDAIPLKHPAITWPQSVARHPLYLKLLARFERVWAVSAASRDELMGFWRWQGIDRPPPVEVLALGADFNRSARITTRVPAAGPARLLVLGIIEPRKNQGFLLEVCEALWTEGLEFELHVVGRVNPHFGPPIVRRLRELQRTRGSRLQFHEAATDARVAEIAASARALLFPTRAEGCGLPLLEALWQGLPCVCSDLPVLRENADAGGCVAVPLDDLEAWKTALRRIVTDDAYVANLMQAATTRPLPTWDAAGRQIIRALT